MDEEYQRIEKIVGNQHKYQFITLFLCSIIWLSTSYISISVPFFEKKPNVKYYNSTSREYHEKARLTYEICDNYNYTIISSYDYSYTERYDINCEEFKVGLVGGTISFAMLIGAILQAVLVDFIGRRKTLIISLVFYSLFTFGLLFIPIQHDLYYTLYIACFCIMTFGSCSYICAFLYICEMNTFANRPICSGFINASGSLCGIIHIMLYRFFNNLNLNISVTLILSILSAILVIFVFYETPKFYFVQGKFKEFLMAFRNIASFNNRFLSYDYYLNENIDRLEKIFFYEEINNDYLKLESTGESLVMNIRSLDSFYCNQENHDVRNSLFSFHPLKSEEEVRKKVESIYASKEEESSTDDDIFEQKYQRINTKKKYIYSLCDVMKLRSQRYTFLMLSLIWFSTSAIYYSIGNVFIYFKGSIEVNGLIFYSVEFLFYCLSGYIVNFKNVGRIKLLIAFRVLAFILFLINFIFDFKGYAINTIFFLYKIFASGSNVILFIYSYEVYPMVLRSKGFTLNIVIGKLGALVANILIEILFDKAMIGLEVLSGLSLLVIMHLPETVIQKENDIHPPEKLLVNEENTVNEVNIDLK